MFKKELNRLYNLNNLRAFIALLGIPFHTTLLLVLSTSKNIHDFDLYQLIHNLSPYQSSIFLSAFFIHVFRMPAFFLLAGFFAHVLYERRGTTGFFKNRLMRIGIPFLVIMLWLIPSYLNFVFMLAAEQKVLYHTNFSAAFSTIIQQHYINGFLWHYFNNTRDSWFLYNLLLLYGVTLIFLSCVHYLSTSSIKTSFVARFNNWFQKKLFTPYVYLILPTLFSLLLLTSHNWFAYVDTNLLPGSSLLLFYGLWYLLGWCLWNHRDQFSRFSSNCWIKLVGGILVYVLYLILYFRFATTSNNFAQWFCLLLYCLAMTLTIFSLLGIVTRHLNHSKFTLNYISAASYWIYLIQMPILYILIPLLQGFHLFFTEQLLIAIFLCTLLCLFSYELLVRHTWLKKIVGAANQLPNKAGK